ncbi:hypothetical protein [Mariniplasma anaerobium]|uniref:Uncharacterized protein n=1 Tax=Mariniplasma anaerobium TaxID=2735436 RepID=A0A7U9THQ5_9MOLU|nr:hypothetical protein [Mariniplasma anaerobium]BCR36665.1 hypothetical protein MPAN_015580 [Mariniplasma anaerobium]
MKKIILKIVLTISALLLGYIIINVIMGDGKTDGDGSFELIILDSNQDVVYNEVLYYEEGQTFFDVLNENFELTCANRLYEADDTCGYKFTIMQYKNHVVLGIKSDVFEIMTDWDNTFLKIEIYDGNEYVRSTIGFDYVNIEENKKIRISADLVE